jgi:phospholipid/cholesterol/gamma-HCH transport system substrate-binding protein
MTTSPKKRGILVGLFIIIGLIFLLAGILTIGNLHETFVRKIKVTVLFDDVAGLQPGNNIWFSGVKIGTVSNLNFIGKSQVRVIMKIDEKAVPYIRKDAKVKLSTDGLIGNKILVIYGGTEKSPEVKEGDTLGIEKTFSTEDMMNTFQENNKNFLVISNNLKSMSIKLANGEGSIGKLLKDETLYNTITATTESLQLASINAQQMIAKLSDFSSKLNDKGTLANQLVTDTTVFNSLKKSVVQIQNMSDTAKQLVTNLKNASTNPKSPLGVMLHDEKTGSELKSAITNLESSSKKLDEDLEALQHNFLFRRYFKKKGK